MAARRLAAFALLLLACSGSPPAKPNVAIFVLDTARPQSMSVYGHPRPTTPFLERFAAQGRRFDRAYSVSSWTLPAHASLLTGQLPAVHGAFWHRQRVAADTPLLAERLRDAGYQAAGFSNNILVSQRTGFTRGFDRFDPPTALRDGPPGTPHRTVDVVTRWLTDERDPERPFFLFVNLIDPHMPYLPPWEMAEPFYASRDEWQADIEHFFPEGHPRTLLDRHYARREPLSSQEWRRLERLYEGDLRLTDAIVERLVAVLDAASAPDETLVFIVSDHGENLGEHDHLGHVFNLYDTNIAVAMLARGPGFEPGSVESGLVQLTDVMPTVLHATGLATPADATLPGRDLRQPMAPGRVLTAVLEMPSEDPFTVATRESGALAPYRRELRAAVTEGRKRIEGTDGTVERFDLASDPAESHPLAGGRADPEAGEAPLAETLETVAYPGGPGVSARASARDEMDERTVEQLRGLGYLD